MDVMSGAMLVVVGSCLGASLFALRRFGPSTLRAPGGAALHIQLHPGAAEKLSCPADPVSIADITDERSTGLATGEA